MSGDGHGSQLHHERRRERFAGKVVRARERLTVLMTSFQFQVVRRTCNIRVYDDVIEQQRFTHNNIGALIVLVTLRGPCISIGVGDGDRVSPTLTRATDALSLYFWSSMAFLRTTSCALTCSISASCAINARRRTTARYSVSRRLTLSRPK